MIYRRDFQNIRFHSHLYGGVRVIYFTMLDVYCFTSIFLWNLVYPDIRIASFLLLSFFVLFPLIGILHLSNKKNTTYSQSTVEYYIFYAPDRRLLL
jgi:NADH:ubiquinone oxidoreductase subunit 3 (subunit A)